MRTPGGNRRLTDRKVGLGLTSFFGARPKKRVSRFQEGRNGKSAVDYCANPRIYHPVRQTK